MSPPSLTDDDDHDCRWWQQGNQWLIRRFWWTRQFMSSWKNITSSQQQQTEWLLLDSSISIDAPRKSWITKLDLQLHLPTDFLSIVRRKEDLTSLKMIHHSCQEDSSPSTVSQRLEGEFLSAILCLSLSKRVTYPPTQHNLEKKKEREKWVVKNPFECLSLWEILCKESCSKGFISEESSVKVIIIYDDVYQHIWSRELPQHLHYGHSTLRFMRPVDAFCSIFEFLVKHRQRFRIKDDRRDDFSLC